MDLTAVVWNGLLRGGHGDWSKLEPKANISASEKVVTYKTRKKGTA